MKIQLNYLLPLTYRVLPFVFTVFISVVPLVEYSFDDLWGAGHYFYFIPMYVLSVAIFLAHRGVFLDVRSRSFKPYWSFLFVPFGKRKKVPKQGYLMLTTRAANGFSGRKVGLRYHYLRLKIPSQAEEYVLMKSFSRKKVMRMARVLGRAWGLDLFGERGSEKVLVLSKLAA